ncbi:AfsR/SARP family transcriptional regulator, partial [Streptomyces purpurogeneiscleroticus]|uniref:AfsR/SARP family transcriptional regulator n=1 Tax=Streptomyces purpurogeneiscleroticus TaxID=68259 RepID=UPI001CBE9245
MSDQLASNALRYEVLGPLRVWLEGAELVLGPAQQRRVLAVLLLHANKSVSREQLIDAVWGTAVPARAVNLLQRNVSALRRLLEPHRAPREPSEILTWTDAGYLLTVSNGQLDLLAFERAAEQARAARAAGDLPEAAKALHGALRLWRGRLCEGLAGPLLDTERYRLEEQRLGVVEQRIEMDLALGVDVDLVGELRRLIAAHPLHERLHGLLMRALHRSGRQAEALQVYQEARRLLNEELGVEPGVELRRTQEQILAADAVL